MKTFKEAIEDFNKKISKQAAMYVHHVGKEYICGECVFFRDNRGEMGKCCFLGTKVTINRKDSCGDYIPGTPGKLPFIAVMYKPEIGFISNPGTLGYSCKRCEYFNAEKKGCKKVNKYSDGPDKGIIHPDGCCNLWGKK